MSDTLERPAPVAPAGAPPNQAPADGPLLDPARFSGDGAGALPGVPRPPDIKRRKRRRIHLLIALAIIAVGGGVAWWTYPWFDWVSTDDAFIDAHPTSVGPQVAGRVLEVPVDDNQAVKKGDVLVRIDPSDFKAAADQAEAQLELARARVAAAKSNLELARATTSADIDQAKAIVEAAKALAAKAGAQVVAARAEAQRTAADWERYKGLSDQAVAPQQRDLVHATAESATASLDAAERAVASAQADIVAAQGRLAAAEAAPHQIAMREAEVRSAEAAVGAAKAALDTANLNLSYTTVYAPVDGSVARKMVAPGDYVQTGQSLMAIVPDEVWVTANFKETQLNDMRIGQPARIHVDAYPGHVFKGHVGSMQAGTGAAFSLLPPENATGNYVKVVQRVPVKILFDEPPVSQGRRLGPGMSVVPEVKVR